MRDLELATCYGKVCYLSQPDAMSIIRRRLRKQHGKAKFKHFKDERLNAYRCRSCGQWHVGNSVKQSGDNHRGDRGKRRAKPRRAEEVMV